LHGRVDRRARPTATRPFLDLKVALIGSNRWELLDLCAPFPKSPHRRVVGKRFGAGFLGRSGQARRGFALPIFVQEQGTIPPRLARRRMAGGHFFAPARHDPRCATGSASASVAGMADLAQVPPAFQCATSALHPWRCAVVSTQRQLAETLAKPVPPYARRDPQIAQIFAEKEDRVCRSPRLLRKSAHVCEIRGWFARLFRFVLAPLPIVSTDAACSGARRVTL
jgi:hypothetical protein